MQAMRLFIPGLVALAAAAAALVPASAQEDRMARPEPEAIIYRDAGYRGPAVNVTREQPDMGLAWPVNSIRVRAGRWELCERTNFRGQCRTLDADVPMLGNLLRGITVQSLRPVGGGGGGGGGGTVPGNNPSLRGMAAEFYTQPALDGRRVLACERGNATANCAANTADEFCETMGWTGSASQAMETVSGRVYLADVLCSRTGY